MLKTVQTVVRFDFVGSKGVTDTLYNYVGINGISGFISQIKDLMNQALQTVNEQYNLEEKILGLEGDAGYLIFDNANDAHIFAQNLLCNEKRWPFRIGAATGEITQDRGGELVGKPIAIAQRLEAYGAKAGCFCIDTATYNALSPDLQQKYSKKIVRGNPFDEDIIGWYSVMIATDDYLKFLDQQNTEISPDIGLTELGLSNYQPNVVITSYERTAQCFLEDLGKGIQLEMMLIPGGTFIMGSPKEEEDSYDDEHPQHQVTIKPFFIGRYQVTQAQWQAVAAMPKVNRELDPDPSNFKGVNRPVEQVSWHEAVEFCSRLSQHTGRNYRLPSEAEWEYACRAGTTTPFHFGETISTDLANYRGTDNEDLKWSGSYGQGPKGVYRKETTEVGNFGVANNFGLYDMHGNVWEWCLDDWHSNYEDAPTNGSAWFSSDEKLINKTGQAVLRGGSWFNNPRLCRSAYRHYGFRVNHYYYIGFRVVCAVGRILQ